MSDSQSTNNTRPSPSSILEELQSDSEKSRPDLITLTRQLPDEGPIGGEEELTKLTEIVNEPYQDGSLSFDEDLIKADLDEVLLLLVVIRGQANGKQALGDISRVFGHRLSPGTVYPHLHKLEHAGLLEMHETVRTKEYSLRNSETAQRRLARIGAQHLALATMYFDTLEQLKPTTDHEIDE